MVGVPCQGEAADAIKQLAADELRKAMFARQLSCHDIGELRLAHTRHANHDERGGKVVVPGVLAEPVVQTLLADFVRHIVPK